MTSRFRYPVIDLFAGPGGLGEGFVAYQRGGLQRFRIVLSIEKDEEAHRTLELRAFFRQFQGAEVPDAYYEHLRGRITREALFKSHLSASSAAASEAWRAELGKIDPAVVHRRVRTALSESEEWVLIGGPPCQAYSLVGRSRVRSVDPDRYEQDERHFLYQEYLRIIAKHRPCVFVMENVKGLLSAEVKGAGMFARILDDLHEPERATQRSGRSSLRYRLFALSGNDQRMFSGVAHRPEDYVIRCERFGIPQARHRLIILGVRDDLRSTPRALTEYGRPIQLSEVIDDLPRLRSRISRGADSEDAWADALRTCSIRLKNHDAVLSELSSMEIPDTGGEYLPSRKKIAPRYRSEWFADPRLRGVCNHASRSHLVSDIQRYFFAASFAASGNGNAKSPVLADFPSFLLPQHRNVKKALRGGMFEDRFRVQLADRPATTITAHIAKDGHYYIHPDPLQARSLTVREAARIQTFKDNYFFCGPRTSQYQQVGNAVPPLLAVQIAAVVDELLSG